MKNICITSAIRTAVGSLGKSLKNISAEKLGSVVISNAVKNSKLSINDVDEVIMGQVLTGGAGQNPARQAAIKSGIPKEIPAYVVNQVCGSGIRSIASGYQSIISGNSSIIVAGGQENMSLAPHAIHLRDGKKLGNAELVDTMIKDGLWDAFHDYHMGMTAENVAEKFQITREEQDKFALKSQTKAIKAQKQNKFEEEIVNLKIESKKAKIDFKEDEHPREGINLDALSRLKPVFKKDGTVTAGNASGLNDGAAAVLIMKESRAKELGLEIMANIVSWSSVGVDPAIMGIGPVPAVQKALKSADWKIEDLDLIEANEAFAAQSIAVTKELGLDIKKVNVNGGAIALGHPIGASGARILVSLVHELIRQDKNKGIATLCIGGGQGVAMCIERVK